ncbi:hypothetical protein [Streptacidiphilus jiangxiensis]|uniref:Uncharacterized protein n=1 Tax=Streptacidiphilus jiangxiensis TaxID=235985 RepID=A0A1H8A3X9_STRJI|nr:hypothetical protein [Streptacidiphilus jiangxiensis]SEM65602.1 hypothetical protein SAMN05414137_1416 [Streptacidiphilus jiangxiensis]
MTQIPGQLTPRVVAALIDQLLDENPTAAPDHAPGLAPTQAERFSRLLDGVDALTRRLAQQVHFQAMTPGSATPGVLRALTSGRLRLQGALDSLDPVRRFIRTDDQHADEVARRLTRVREHLHETASLLIREGADAVEEAATSPAPPAMGAAVGQDAVRSAEDVAGRLAVVLRRLPRPCEGHDGLVGQLRLAQEAYWPFDVAGVLAAHIRELSDATDPGQVEAHAALSIALSHVGRGIAALGDAAGHQAALARPDAGRDYVARASLDDGLDDAYVALHQAVAVLRGLANAATVGGTSPTIVQTKSASRSSGVPTQRRRR